MSAFQDQVAVVTGASSGIGKSVALSLAEHGATVCLVARRLHELEAIATASRAIPPELLPYQADLTQEGDLNRLVRRLRADFQHIDIIVHRPVFTSGIGLPLSGSVISKSNIGPMCLRLIL